MLSKGERHLSKWSEKCGLGVNLVKTEPVLFTRKHRISDLVLPAWNGIKLKISESAKYLGIILDRKLHWILNSADRINKSTIALFGCEKAIGKICGFNSKFKLIIYFNYILDIYGNC